MKFSSFLLLLAFAGALTASAQENLPNADSAPTVNESIVPIPDCFPCSEDNDPYSEGPADYPPIPFPKPPGLPKCYPICNLEGNSAASLATVAQVSGLTVPGESAAVLFEAKTATSFVPALSLRRSRHGLV